MAKKTTKSESAAITNESMPAEPPRIGWTELIGKRLLVQTTIYNSRVAPGHYETRVLEVSPSGKVICFRFQSDLDTAVWMDQKDFILTDVLPEPSPKIDDSLSVTPETIIPDLLIKMDLAPRDRTKILAKNDKGDWYIIYYAKVSTETDRATGWLHSSGFPFKEDHTLIGWVPLPK